MERFIKAIENGGSAFLQINIEEPGISMTMYTKVVDFTNYLDGITLHLENEGAIFLSSFLSEVIEVDENEDSTKFVITTIHNTAITILVANE